MMINTDYPLPLKKTDASSGRLFVPHCLTLSQNTVDTFPTKIAFGSRTALCLLEPHPEGKDEWVLSDDVWHMLHIPFETSIHAFQNDQTLHLGPLIGIFTAGFTSQPLRPIGERSIMFSKYLRPSSDIGGYTFIFGAHHIHWEKGTLEGLFYTSTGWQKRTIPLPSVVYDRVPNRKVEQHDKIRMIKHRLQNEYLIPWFNPSFFNKWEMYTLLKKHDDLASIVPETVLNPTLSQLKALFNHYHTLYIKPVHGSLGSGIHKITVTSDGSYYCRFRDNTTNRLRRYQSLEHLITTQFDEQSLTFMIAQQGITRIKIDDRPLDFRVHTNKDEHGEWLTSTIAAKVAGKHSITTHLNNGGKIMTVRELLPLLGDYRESLEQLPSIAQTISRVLDLDYPGTIGELGFDFGIDKEGHIWLFEVNARPGRSIFKHPDLKHDALVTRTLPLQYATYLVRQELTDL